MKICIGYRVVTGPWGGGNSFYRGLETALRKAGHSVVNTLHDPDIDFIILTDPRFGRRNKNIPFSYNNAWRYVKYKNRNCLIIHRINECDERKGTSGINSKLKNCNSVADYTVFVGSWLQDLDLWQGRDFMPSTVILNGSDRTIFFPSFSNAWSGKEPLKLVTHHWSNNWMKGFDAYHHIDQLLNEPNWRELFQFTYVGNLPKGYSFENTRHVPPLSGLELGNELRKHHGYITGSICEPGGNHQNEGAQCGLPVVYLESGCMPEYLNGYGLGYSDISSLEERLLQLHAEYDRWRNRVLSYPQHLEKTCSEWLSLLESLHRDRCTLVSNRKHRSDRFFSNLFRLLAP